MTNRRVKDLSATEWRLHVGAHKTATTHLQRTLELLQPRLAQSGVYAMPTATFRPIWGQVVHQNRRLRWLVANGLPVTPFGAAQFAGKMDALKQECPSVLISEENIIGHTHQGVAETPYARLSERVRLLRALLGRQASVQVFFSIREMGTFLPSIYSEALRFFPLRGPFETLAAEVLARPPRWTDIVQRLRHAWPEARLSVWLYEDYQAHTAAIVKQFTGCDPGPLPTVARPRSTMTPSAEAVRAVESDPGLDGLDIRTREQRVGEIYAKAPAEGARTAFRPLTPEQATRCRDAYEADCAALEKAGLLWTP